MVTSTSTADYAFGTSAPTAPITSGAAQSAAPDRPLPRAPFRAAVRPNWPALIRDVAGSGRAIRARNPGDRRLRLLGPGAWPYAPAGTEQRRSPGQRTSSRPAQPRHDARRPRQRLGRLPVATRGGSSVSSAPRSAVSSAAARAFGTAIVSSRLRSNWSAARHRRGQRQVGWRWRSTPRHTATTARTGSGTAIRRSGRPHSAAPRLRAKTPASCNGLHHPEQHGGNRRAAQHRPPRRIPVRTWNMQMNSAQPPSRDADNEMSRNSPAEILNRRGGQRPTARCPVREHGVGREQLPPAR